MFVPWKPGSSWRVLFQPPAWRRLKLPAVRPVVQHRQWGDDDNLANPYYSSTSRTDNHDSTWAQWGHLSVLARTIPGLPGCQNLVLYHAPWSFTPWHLDQKLVLHHRPWHLVSFLCGPVSCATYNSYISGSLSEAGIISQQIQETHIQTHWWGEHWRGERYFVVKQFRDFHFCSGHRVDGCLVWKMSFCVHDLWGFPFSVNDNEMYHIKMMVQLWLTQRGLFKWLQLACQDCI